MLDSIKYYKIDNNLFDINRYQQIDTLSKKVMTEQSFISVEELWGKGRKKIDSISDRESKLKTGIIYISDTHNDFFPFIYVIEKLSDCKYKRTRVWWVDY